MKLLTTFTLLAVILVALYGAGVNGTLQCCDVGSGCRLHQPEACKHGTSCVPIQCSMAASSLEYGKDADGEDEA